MSTSIDRADPARTTPADIRPGRNTVLELLLLLLLVPASDAAPEPAAPVPSTPTPHFTTVDGPFQPHFNGMTGQRHFPEMMGAGGALVDVDGDGDLDLYQLQGALIASGETLADVRLPGGAKVPKTLPSDRLYRNLMVESGRLAFKDVTADSGLMAEADGAYGYGMSVAAGDIDNDGDVDLYVANLGPDQLWRNRGDGAFDNVTASAFARVPGGWSAAAAFVDLDADGWLDLYVVRYVDFRADDPPTCFATDSRADYCGPDAFAPLTDRLYRNRGDGTFED
ncbi:MAG: VCBS repeat-containing protein, partial [Acidobacteriota bacterium]